MNYFEPWRAYDLDDCVAVGDAGTRTMRDLLRDVSAVSAQLEGCQGELLVSCVDRYYLAVTMLAAWQRGIVVALPPNAREQTLAELRERCARAVHDASGPGDDVRGWLSSATDSAAPEALRPLPSERCIVTAYTSGSTGMPSACRKNARQLLGEGETLHRSFGLTRESCVLATVPAHHIYGLLFSITMPLSAGARFVRETPLHTPVIVELAQRHGADLLVSVPAHLHALAESSLASLAAIRCVFSSGAPLPGATARELHRRFSVDVREILGSTETGGFAWRAAEQLDARYRPFPGIGLSVGEDAQLLLRSPLLDADVQQPLACPDRIELNPDGSFHHLGRMDGVIKVGGTRVALPELEARVRSLPGVLDAVALAVDATNTRGQELWLVIASDAGRELPDLRNDLLRYYEPVVLPRRVRFVAALPREATGKLPRAQLLALFAQQQPEPSQSVVVQTRTPYRSEKGADGWRISVHVPDDLVHFVGHFAGDPILPAIAQIDMLVLDEITVVWPELVCPRELVRLKWKSPIRPGDAIEVDLLRHGPTRVDFVISRGAEVCAQGTVDFGAAAP